MNHKIEIVFEAEEQTSPWEGFWIGVNCIQFTRALGGLSLLLNTPRGSIAVWLRAWKWPVVKVL